MRLTSFVVSRSWASNRLRTGLSILGVALGVAVVTAIHVIDHNTIQSRIRELRPDFGRVDFELVPLAPDRDVGDLRAELRATDGIGDVGLLSSTAVEVSPADSPAPVQNARLFGLSPLPSRAFAHYFVEEGEDLEDLDGDEWVLISRGLALTAHVAVGQELVLHRPSVPVRARCRGGELVLEDVEGREVQPARVRVKGILAHENLARRNLGLVVIGSYALARRLGPDERTFYQINRTYGADADRLRQTLAGTFQVLDERSALLGEASDERAFRNGVKVLGCLALVLGMFVVFQTLSQSLVERLKQIGLLRCLGASRRSVAAIFLLDALLMAVIGVLLGIGLGLLIAWGMKAMNFTTLGVGKQISTFEVPPVPILWTALLGLTFTLAGAAFPLWKARSVPAISVLNARGLGGTGDGEPGEFVLRGVNVFLFVLLVLVLPAAYLAMTPLLTESEHETRVVLLQMGGMILLFGAILLLSPRLVSFAGRAVLVPLRRYLLLPAFLVQKSLARQGGRFASSVCGLAVVLVALVALQSLTAALCAEIREFGAVTMRDTLFVQSDPLTTRAAASLAGIDGVAAVDAIEGTRQVPFQLSGLGPESLTRPGAALAREPELAQAYASTAERTLILSRRLAHLYGLEPGSMVPVLTDDGRPLYRVLLVTDAAGFFPDDRAWAVTAPHWMKRDFCVQDERVQRIALRLDPKSRPDAVLTAVRARFPNVTWSKSGAEIVAYHLRDVHRDFMLFDVLLVLILCLAVLGLVNAMTIAALARVREIGVLRALGMQSRQLRTSFLIEGLLVGGLAALVADLLGIPMGMVMVQGLNRVTGLSAPFDPPLLAMALVPVLGVGIGALSAVLPGLRAVRQSPAESVRYE